MAPQVLDEKTLKSLPPKERARLQQSLKGEGGDPKARKKKKRGSGKLLVLVLYSAACGVGGAYVDRHFLPQVRIWLGDQAQTLADLGTEQKIHGMLQQADLTPSARQRALENVRAVYAASKAGALDAGQTEQMLRAEAPFVAAAQQGTVLSTRQLEKALEIFADLADDL